MPPAPEQAVPRDVTDLAWQGLRFSLPSEWNPLEVIGGRAKGALRIGDLRQTMMEVVWRAPGWLDHRHRVWTRYLKQIGVTPQKAADLLERCPVHADRLRDGGWVDPIVVRLRSDRSGSVHALVRGPHTGRFVLIRMPLPPKCDEEAWVGPILAALREDDPAQPQTWSIYGLRVGVPGGSDLAHVRLQPGHLALRFRTRRMRIEWERLSFGGRILADRSVSEWFAQRGTPRQTRRWQAGPSVNRGASSLVQRPRWTQRLKPTRWQTGTRAAAWHLESSDQLVLLTVEGRFHGMGLAFSKMCDGWQVRID